MLKVSTFLHQNELGYTTIPLFGPADKEFEKVAGASLLAPVSQYIASLRPRPESQYVLVNALGASEFFGSNINGDAFPEAALIHAPPGWTGNPLVDKQLAKEWAYGFPTFYNAHAFAHHRNKDASRAYGDVELAAWNDHMKRVELVVRVDYSKCVQFGGIAVWDKLKAGQYPDVSMGSKVPFDTSSITLDWDEYSKAKATFDVKRHRHPGQAVLEYHKKKPIQGLSITRDDYDEYCTKYMNRILPDGRKVFVYNDFPRFFDISFVFIGADRTAKVLVYIVRNGDVQAQPSTKVAAAFGDNELSFEKSANIKGAEIAKDVLSIPDSVKAIPLLTGSEPNLTSGALNALCAVPEGTALSTMTGLGMLLNPGEFQKMTLTRMGQGPLADLLAAKNITFAASTDSEPCPMHRDMFLPSLARLLVPFFSQRTALAPSIEHRVTVTVRNVDPPAPAGKAQDSELLRKIGAAYNGYRQQVLSLVPYSQDFISTIASKKDIDLLKTASASVEETFTLLSYCYLRNAYMNDLPTRCAK